MARRAKSQSRHVRELGREGWSCADRPCSPAAAAAGADSPVRLAIPVALGWSRAPSDADRAPDRAATSGPAAVRYSKLSSTRSRRRSPTIAARGSLIGRLPVSSTPRARAIVGRTSAGSRSGARSTKATPSGNCARVARAASCARRVLPMPPGPVRVTRRAAPATVPTRPLPGRVRGEHRPGPEVAHPGRWPHRAGAVAPMREVREPGLMRSVPPGSPPRAPGSLVPGALPVRARGASAAVRIAPAPAADYPSEHEAASVPRAPPRRAGWTGRIAAITGRSPRLS